MFLTVDDLSSFADIEPVKAQEMIEDATALAVLAAPCLADPSTLTDTQTTAVRAILRGAILRWNDAGSGAIQTESIDDYSRTLDQRQVRRGMFWPSEILQLQNVCGSAKTGGAFSIDQVPATVAPTFADRPDLWFQYYFPVPPAA